MPRKHETSLALPASNTANRTGEPHKSKRPNLSPLLALRSYVMRHPARLTGTLVALVVSAGAMLAIPMAVRRMIDFGFSASNSGLIGQYFAMLVVIAGVLAIASACRFYLVNWIGERVVADLRADVFANVTHLGPAYFETTHSGDIMSRLTADTTQIKAAAAVAISQALRNLIMLVGALVMMAITSSYLSVLALLAIPAILLPVLALARTVRARSRTAQDTLATASAYAAENLSAVNTMQAYTAETHVSARYSKAVEQAFVAGRARLLVRAIMTALAIFMVVTSIVFVLWSGAAMVAEGTMSAGALAQFVLYAVFAAGALAELSEVWGEVQNAAGAADRLMELRSAIPPIPAPVTPTAMPEPAIGNLDVENLSFAYPTAPETSVLNDISFSITPGEMVAIVGASGAGKTSILNLLLRFYAPSAGAIRIDGIDIAKATPTHVRQRIGLVPQDVAIFADTVHENIRYGQSTASDEAVRQAANLAHAHEFIERLANGYDTVLGERGTRLSGGQRQRLAIARAILRDPAILLLDEATSALDAESEQAVQRALEGVMRNRTTIVIAHRLATIQKADRILVLDGGRIVEQGHHTDLIAAGGVYARLAKLQFTSST